MSLPIDRTAKTTLDANLVNGITSDAPTLKASDDIVYNTIDELYNYASGLVAGGVLQPYPAFLSRQAIINGNFDVWQRGTSFSGFVYNADRWLMRGDGSGESSTVSRQSFTVGQGVVPNEPKYFWRKQVTVAPTGQTYHQLAQRIESVRAFANSKVTVSFWAKADAARTLQSTFQQVFGTGGSPSPGTGTAVQSHSLTTTWQKFTATFSLPSISGKTLGTNGDDYLEFDFILPINSLLTIDIAQVQVNAGDQALPFQPRSFADELALCQRYYEKSYDYVINSGTASTGTTAIGFNAATTTPLFNIYFKHRKRVQPTATLYSPFTGALGKARDSTAGVDISATVNNLAEAQFAIIYGTTTIGNSISQHFAADAEL